MTEADFTLTPHMAKLVREEWEQVTTVYPLLLEPVEGLGGGPGSYLWRITAQMSEVFPGVACHAVADSMEVFRRRCRPIRARRRYRTDDPNTRLVWKMLLLRALMSGTAHERTYRALRHRFRLLRAADGASAVDQLAALTRRLCDA